MLVVTILLFTFNNDKYDDKVDKFTLVFVLLKNMRIFFTCATRCTGRYICCGKMSVTSLSAVLSKRLNTSNRHNFLFVCLSPVPSGE